MTLWPEPPVNVLVSYHYFPNHDLDPFTRLGLRLIGDSGAYSALTKNLTIDPHRYHQWAQRWSDTLLWAAGLDVIGDQEATWRNWRDAPAGLNLVPTIHFPDPPTAIDRYAEAGATLIGLGGMVPRTAQPNLLMRWLAPIFRHARDHHPGVRFHGWGIQHPHLLNNLPWFSTDSSGFAAAYRYARLRLWDRRTNTTRTIRMQGAREPAEGRDLLRQYGLRWQDFTVSHPENRPALIRAGVLSVQRQQEWLADRHRVTPPAVLADRLPQGFRGPMLFIVDRDPAHLRKILPAHTIGAP